MPRNETYLNQTHLIQMEEEKTHDINKLLEPVEWNTENLD
jgi:hypothetical protein